ncbi:MAG: acyl-CoA dehydrogenase family protein [Myxococcota bacterium]
MVAAYVEAAREDVDTRARGLVAPLRERSDEIERGRRLPAEVAADIATAGMFRLLVPKSFGGAEVRPEAFVRTLSTLAEGDAAAAWCVMTGATTSLLSAYLPPEAAAAIWGNDPKVVTAGVFAPSGRAVPTEGGYRLSGRWSFASGCDNATWCMGGALVMDGETPRAIDGKPEIRSLLFRAEAARIVDTWDVAGLNGTGSHDLVVEDVFVPASHTACLMTDAPQHDGTLYRFPVFGLLAAGVAAVALGIGRAAIDELTALVRRKRSFGGGRTLAEQDLVQVEVARAEAELGAGRAFLLERCEAAWAAAEAGALTPADRAGLRLAATHATRAAVRAVDAMYQAGGGTALYRSKSPLQRHFRDVHTVTQHIMVAPNTDKTVGRVLLGVPTDVAQL